MEKFYTIYQITNLVNNFIYIGAHFTSNIEDQYMGSSKYLKEDIIKYGKSSFTKEILHVFDNKEDMINMESKIVNKEFCMRYDTYNKMVGGISSVSWDGMIVTKDKEGNVHSVYKNDPRFLSGELVGIAKGTSYTKGTCTVKDIYGNSFKVAVDDPRFLSGELVGISKGNSGNKSFLGRNHKEESKKKIGERNSISQSGERNSNYGKKRSDEFKELMRDKFSHEFLVYDLDENFISEEKNIVKYARDNNLNASSIVKVLQGKYKYTGGLIFKYKSYNEAKQTSH